MLPFPRKMAPPAPAAHSSLAFLPQIHSRSGVGPLWLNVQAEPFHAATTPSNPTAQALLAERRVLFDERRRDRHGQQAAGAVDDDRALQPRADLAVLRLAEELDDGDVEAAAPSESLIEAAPEDDDELEDDELVLRLPLR